MSHILRTHKEPVTSTSSSSDSTLRMHTLLQCNICGKVLFSQRNLDNYKLVDHKITAEPHDVNETMEKLMGKFQRFNFLMILVQKKLWNI